VTFALQSVIAPAGPHAARVATLFWVSVGIATVVYLATTSALLWSAWRAHRRPAELKAEDADAERRMSRAVGSAIAATVVLLLVFFGFDLAVGRALRTPKDPAHLLVKVTGNQWWWKVEYPDSMASRWVTDANEIHVPVGRTVLVELTSNDVIHSLWMPNLAGKKDLIPRYKDTLWFRADTAGVYRGQCAEFCGHQHAKMAIEVVAHAPADFAQWLERSRQPAPPPSDTLQRRGQEVFFAGPCVLCHAVQGTLATSHAGPDLTHVASRLTLAAGTLPNTKGNLAAWIVDPQGIKPGSSMPSNALSPADLEALLAYLGSLK
jgi:cytochrome c oxidase subunit II